MVLCRWRFSDYDVCKAYNVYVVDGDSVFLMHSSLTLFRRIAAEVLFLDGFALVVFFLAPCEGDVKLGIAGLGDEETSGNDGQALLLDGAGQLAELLAGEQQLPVPFRVMAVESAPPVLGNVHVLDIELPSGKITPAVHQRGLTCADGFYLSAGKNYSCGVVFQKFVFVRSLFVADLYFAFSFGHGRKDSQNSFFASKKPEIEH